MVAPPPPNHTTRIGHNWPAWALLMIRLRNSFGPSRSLAEATLTRPPYSGSPRLTRAQTCKRADLPVRSFVHSSSRLA